MASKAMKKLIQEIVKINNITNYKVQMVSGNKGEGFFGSIEKAKLFSGDEIKMNIFTKAEQIKADLSLPSEVMYRNEIMFYKDIIPAYTRFCRKIYGDAKVLPVPDYYHHIEDEGIRIIAIEDLSEENYQTLQRKTLADNEHVSKTLEELGKFHAIGFAFRKQHPEEFSEMESEIKTSRKIISDNKQFNEMTASACRDVVDKLGKKGLDKEIIDNLHKYRDYESILNDLGSYDGRYGCLLHGDLWTNNIMYKYQDHETKHGLQELRFLDWQLINIGTPVYDLSYFLFSSAQSTILDDYLRYLSLYHKSLSKTLREFNEDPDDVFPYSVLLDDWRLYSKMGMICSFLIHKVKTTAPENIKSSQEASSSSTDHVTETLSSEDFDHVTYWKRIRDVVVAANTMQCL